MASTTTVTSASTVAVPTNTSLALTKARRVSSTKVRANLHKIGPKVRSWLLLLLAIAAVVWFMYSWTNIPSGGGSWWKDWWHGSSSSDTVSSASREVISVGAEEVEVVVGDDNCIRGGKNFNKVAITWRDNDGQDLYRFGVVSKSGKPVEVTFLRYPIGHERCSEYYK